ncbi:MAG: helix-turn-helix domain-containing protein [Clostridia bacterium]
MAISDFLTTREAAEYIGRSVAGLYQLANRGRLAYTRPAGGKCYYRKADLDEFLSSGYHPSAAEITARADRQINGEA